MMTKSLVYMVLAVAVGYLLVSALPQQVSMYTGPQRSVLTSGAEESLSSKGDKVNVTPEDGSDAAQAAEAAKSSSSQPKSFEVSGLPFESSALDTSRLLGLLKGWTLDVLIAVIIYWAAKQRLT